MWFPNRSDTNRPVQAQKRARSLKFYIYVEEELYYPSSENKGADHYREADLRLCFRLCRLLVLPRGGSSNDESRNQRENELIEYNYKIKLYSTDQNKSTSRHSQSYTFVLGLS